MKNFFKDKIFGSYFVLFIILSAILIGYLYLPKQSKASFSYYRSITIDHTKVGTVNNTDQTDFPVLIAGTYSYLATVGNGGKVQNSSGYDIGFYSNSDCSTGKLNWETEKYSASDGTVVYWVKITSVSHSADTIFYMCYGDSGISSDQSNKTGTWNSGYLMVQHLTDGATLSLTDSTSNANNGTNNNSTATAGQFDGDDNFNGTTQYFQALGTPPAGAFTVSMWIKPNAVNANGMFVYSEGYGGATEDRCLS